MLTARREAFAPILPAGGDALRRLDVTLLAVALERLCGIDRAATTTGGRVGLHEGRRPRRSAGSTGGSTAADAAFLLEPTPVADIVAVAATGT